MILSITLNPSVDISYRLLDFQLNQVNRCNDTIKTAGGKGLNVARVLKSLGIPVIATGFTGGANGKFILEKLDGDKIEQDFVLIKGNTRNCIAMIHDSNQTEILESGPFISKEEQQSFLRKLEALLPKVRIVTASGSLPPGVDYEFYKQIIDIANKYQKPVLLDTSGEALKKSLESRPLFIKPNLSEFEKLVGRSLQNEESIVNALRRTKFPVPYIMVTLGAKGSIIKHENKLFRIMIPHIDAINPVGSGDATVAGFAAGLYMKLPISDLIIYSTIAGMLNALEEETGKINVSQINKYKNRIQVTELF